MLSVISTDSAHHIAGQKALKSLCYVLSRVPRYGRFSYRDLPLYRIPDVVCWELVI
jgi:hypothetical protein